MEKLAFFNPQDSAKQIMKMSFLKSRGQMRETGSKFFHDNRIRSCSYAKQDKDQNLKAIPFYEKRQTKVYPTNSDVTHSWSSKVHSHQKSLNAGMGSTKPLAAYNPGQKRNLLNVPDFIPSHPNNSCNVKIGSRNQSDKKHYFTNYVNSNSFVHQSRRIPSNHPGIQALRNKWIKSRLEK